MYIEVANTTLKSLENFFKAREALTGMAPDPSIEGLPTRMNTSSKIKTLTYTSAKDVQGIKERIESKKQNYALQSAAIKKAVNAKRAR